MKLKMLVLSLMSIFILSLVSCVPQKKFTEMESRAQRLSGDSIRFYNQILGYKGSISKMELENEMLQTKLDKNISALSNSQQTIHTQQARLAELQESINQQRIAREALRKTISEALTSFGPEQLTVALKNGKVYVSMSEQLLFASGSADVSKEGRDALASLASALNANSDINVNIEGHTDSIPIAKKFIDNWALSVARSTAITRILIDDYKVQPTRIVSSGRSEFLPMADNATPEGRAKNRRTEIILEPKLDKIMELIGETGND